MALVNFPITTGGGDSTTDQTAYEYQYGRRFVLTVYNSNLLGIDLSQLRCKFSVKQSSNMTPNGASIRVYNLDNNTALLIKQQFTRVVMEGGYFSNPGVIFQGNIKQVIIGRESATDTFIELNCGDGDLAYNYAIVNTSIASGSSQADQLAQIAAPMAKLGVGMMQNQPALQKANLPRGKTLFGQSRDKLRDFAKQNGLTWSIQNEKLGFIPQNSFAPGTAVKLTSQSGMIGTPEQTTWGVNVVCLMNPMIHPGQRIQLDNASIADIKIDANVVLNANSIPALHTADGIYYVLVVEQSGDTRGVEWYSKLICGTVNNSGAGISSVPANYGV